MAKFSIHAQRIQVARTLQLGWFEVEAETREEAEALAQQKIENPDAVLNWHDQDLQEAEYEDEEINEVESIDPDDYEVELKLDEE